MKLLEWCDKYQITLCVEDSMVKVDGGIYNWWGWEKISKVINSLYELSDYKVIKSNNCLYKYTLEKIPAPIPPNISIVITGANCAPDWESTQNLICNMTGIHGRFTQIDRKDKMCNYRAKGEYNLIFRPYGIGRAMTVQLIVQ